MINIRNVLKILSALILAISTLYLFSVLSLSQVLVSDGNELANSDHEYFSPMTITYPLSSLITDDVLDKQGKWSAGYFRDYICDDVCIETFMIGRVKKNKWNRPKLSTWAVLRTNSDRDKYVDLNIDIYCNGKRACGTIIFGIDVEENKTKHVEAIFPYPADLFARDCVPEIKIAVTVRDNG